MAVSDLEKYMLLVEKAGGCRSCKFHKVIERPADPEGRTAFVGHYCTLTRMFLTLYCVRKGCPLFTPKSEEKSGGDEHAH